MLRYMKYAYAVYTEKSFTKAAEKLYISQPSLSATIKKLETELGAPVFERCAREITLTDIGEKYIKAIEQIMAVERNFKDEIDDLLQLKRGQITIGSAVFVSSYVLPKILKSFKEKYPYIDINIVVEHSTALETMLENGTVDMVIDNVTKWDEGFEHIHLLNEQIVLAVPESSPVCQRLLDYQLSYETLSSKYADYQTMPKVSMAEFKDESFILLKPGNKMRIMATKIFKESGIVPKISCEFDQLMTSVNYVENGFGCCFLTDMILKNFAPLNNVVYFLPETEHSVRSLYIMYKKSKYLSAAAHELISHIKGFQKG